MSRYSDHVRDRFVAWLYGTPAGRASLGLEPGEAPNTDIHGHTDAGDLVAELRAFGLAAEQTADNGIRVRGFVDGEP